MRITKNERRNIFMDQWGFTVPNLLASYNTAFLPLAVNSLGGAGSPSLSMLLHGLAYPIIRPQDRLDVSGNKISLSSDKDSKTWDEILRDSRESNGAKYGVMDA